MPQNGLVMHARQELVDLSALGPNANELVSFEIEVRRRKTLTDQCLT
jgi:hypothetical protein